MPAEQGGRTMWSVQAARKKLFRRAACASGAGIKLNCGPGCSCFPPPAPARLQAASLGGQLWGNSTLRDGGQQGPRTAQYPNPWCLLQLKPLISVLPVSVYKTSWTFHLEDLSNKIEELLLASSISSPKRTGVLLMQNFQDKPKLLSLVHTLMKSPPQVSLSLGFHETSLWGLCIPWSSEFPDGPCLHPKRELCK